MPEPDPKPTPADWPSQRQAIEDHLQNDFLMGKIFKDDLRACLARVTELEQALAPFARYAPASRWHGCPESQRIDSSGYAPTVGDLRRAQEVLRDE